MKKILFVCSHLHSGSSALCDSLNHHPRIQSYSLAKSNPYSSPLDLLSLTEQHHKLNNRSAVHMEELLYNYELGTKVAYQECHFVYVVREPADVLNMMVGNDKKTPSFAARHYTYRLRRLCEMAKKTPGAVLLTWEDLQTGQGIDLIEEYLGLRQPIIYDPSLLLPFKRTYSNELIPRTIRIEAEGSFQQYLYFLKSQSLRRT